MNIIEAIKSEKPFRRLGRDWLYRDRSGYEGFTFSPQCLMADDWEILIVEQTPKEKVKLYTWAYKDNHSTWRQTGFYYKDEDECSSQFQYTELRRLDNTMIEVDE